MPENKEIAANEAARADAQAGLESLLGGLGGKSLGGGQFAFAAPAVDKSGDIEAKRQAIAQKRKEDLALMRAGLSRPSPMGPGAAQEATHLSYPGQDATSFAPPGFFPEAELWAKAMKDRDRKIMVDRARAARPAGSENMSYSDSEIERQRY